MAAEADTTRAILGRIQFGHLRSELVERRRLDGLLFVAGSGGPGCGEHIGDAKFPFGHSMLFGPIALGRARTGAPNVNFFAIEIDV